jgi:hypothetical protein
MRLSMRASGAALLAHEAGYGGWRLYLRDKSQVSGRARSSFFGMPTILHVFLTRAIGPSSMSTVAVAITHNSTIDYPFRGNRGTSDIFGYCVVGGFRSGGDDALCAV